jgi:hypothetical protein
MILGVFLLRLLSTLRRACLPAMLQHWCQRACQFGLINAYCVQVHCDMATADAWRAVRNMKQAVEDGDHTALALLLASNEVRTPLHGRVRSPGR